MKLSLVSAASSRDGIRNYNGFGYATHGMLNSLDNLGYHIDINEPNADVEICFDQAHHAEFSPEAYKILYLPWESTALPTGPKFKSVDGKTWAQVISKVDELWTPSPIIADWFERYMNVGVPIYVYEHGVDHVWEPRSREVEDKITFLHIGSEAARKGGWDTIRAFRTAFKNRDDVALTMKMVNSSWNGIERLGKVHYIKDRYSFSQLQTLFYDHHVYVYPSSGEGFGLTPLQAIATGMPTITVPAWAPYAEFLDPRLNIDSKLVSSPWPKIHPGKVLRPNFDDVVDNMRYAADNYEEIHDKAQERTAEIHARYDWDTLTAKAFGDLEHRLND